MIEKVKKDHGPIENFNFFRFRTALSNSREEIEIEIETETETETEKIEFLTCYTVQYTQEKSLVTLSSGNKLDKKLDVHEDKLKIANRKYS